MKAFGPPPVKMTLEPLQYARAHHWTVVNDVEGVELVGRLAVIVAMPRFPRGKYL